MGGRNSVDIAQATHCAVPQNAGCFFQDTALIYGDPFPDGKLHEGVHIDRGVWYICKSNEFHSKGGPDRDLVRKGHEAYEKAGLPIAPEKAFGVARDEVGDAPREPNFALWVVEVDGVSGLVASPLEKQRVIFGLTMWALSF